ncbi:diguanylate cyclase [Cryobacterium melibiosiphilum]|uniref:Diguanylate cyclase n=1 Tax=Cryobacterium melibiosiphilum TaxID=995039 RepID=A0A3A5MY86_9MICO|nr:diguanylate cyclase [Cryobacterium melibiosiphilum]RJT92313.1 diguanylate cyclase [Cryobacterium melibiosiphilum]
MNLDTPTMFVVSAVVVTLCGVTFIVNAAFNRHDAAGRVWSLAFIAAMLVGVAYGLNMVAPEAWWGIALGNTSLAVCVGSIWSGVRLYNGRSSGSLISVGLVGFVAVTGLVYGPRGGEWAGVVELWIVLALLGALATREAIRGRLGRNLNGRMMAAVMAVTAIFSGARAIVFVIDGPDGVVFAQFFNAGVATMVNLSLVVVMSTAVAVLRAERAGVNAVGDVVDGIRSRAGVLSATVFAEEATDHLDRAAHARAGLVLIGADIDNLPEINTAFGRGAGDEAIERFAQTLRRNAPVMSVIGHHSAGRFLVLAWVASATEALTIAENLQSALVDDPLTEPSQIRLTASFALADTYDHGYDLIALNEAVCDGISTVKLSGGNLIAAADAPALP